MKDRKFFETEATNSTCNNHLAEDWDHFTLTVFTMDECTISNEDLN